MSYIGGPLPGQEKEEESENRDLIQSYKDRTIGKETIDRTISVVQKLQKNSPEWLKQGASTTGSLLKDTYMDARTLEGKEWLNPADVALAGGVRLAEGIGWLGEKAIAKPVEAIAHKALGIDPRGAKFLGIATEIAVTAGGAPKAAKYVKSGAAMSDLTELAFKTADPESIAGMVYRTGGGVAPVPKNLRPDYIPKGDWNKLLTKFGNNPKSARWGSELIKEAHNYFKTKGSLKEFGSIRLDPNTGDSWLLKNKRGTQLTEKSGPRFGLDPLKNTNAGRILREATAVVDEKLVREAAERINTNRAKLGTELLTETQITDYIKAQKRNKSLLKRLIKNLNYDEGLRTWSLGHIEAVKSHIKKGKKGADMITNLELEPFRDMFDEKTGRWIRGNASRSDQDELSDLLLQAINKSETIDEDIVKFTDPVLQNFWPRKGPVSDKTSWLQEHLGQERYIDLVEKYGVDEVYEILAGDLPVSKAPTTTVLSN